MDPETARDYHDATGDECQGSPLLLHGGPKFCAMKITQDVREYAAEQGLEVDLVLSSGMEEKSQEFKDAGSKIYQKS